MSVLKPRSPPTRCIGNRYAPRVGGPDVLKFLLQNDSFPRGISFCLKQLDCSLRTLPRSDAALATSAALQQQLTTAAVPDLAREGMHEFIDQLQDWSWSTARQHR